MISLRSYCIYKLCYNQHPERYTTDKPDNRINFRFLIADTYVATVKGWGGVKKVSQEGIVKGRILPEGIYRIQPTGCPNKGMKKHKSIYFEKKDDRIYYITREKVKDVRRGFVEDNGILTPPDINTWEFAPKKVLNFA